MNTITIPKKISGARDDLVVLPRKAYEALLARPSRAEFAPTRAQKEALKRAERNVRGGKTLSYGAFVRKVDARR